MPDATLRLSMPYENLLLTGFLGVGKTTIARKIVQKVGVDFLDIDDEIELRELMSISKIRELYGEQRLKSLEYEFCRQASLMRRSVIIVPGAALLDSRNFNMLKSTGTIVILSCEVGEALRRLHLENANRYRDPELRGRMIGRIRREYAIVENTEVLQLDTTHLDIDREVELLIDLWRSGEPDMSVFRYGPGKRIKPPARQVVGLSQ